MVSNDQAVLARSVGRGNVLWRSWIVYGAWNSCVVIGIIYVEDGFQERVERLDGGGCGVRCILDEPMKSGQGARDNDIG